MNAAEFRTMCDLAYTKAIELHISAEREGSERIAGAWKEVCLNIMIECFNQCGSFPSLID